MNEDAIFTAAMKLAPGADRDEFLRAACGSDSQLRQKVEALLIAHETPDSFLDEPIVHAQDPSGTSSALEQAGDIIGNYRLLQQIGEGGFGVAYMAEQDEPVQRRVALKIIKPGMDSKDVIARFEAERQALAMMEHSNIAKVLDAGTTHSGRPYFVMELVRGNSITKYCDDQKLTPRDRLALFIPVCKGIQHAHQKGIIHRDIKPSNVLVSQYDGEPVPKVIDFGVAKALHQRLTERTIFTQYGQVIGTFEYMSPEQAEMNQLDVDTRSDIYSLGAVLYELLTGTTPIQRDRLHSAAFDQMLQLILLDASGVTAESASLEVSSADLNRAAMQQIRIALMRNDLVSASAALQAAQNMPSPSTNPDVRLPTIDTDMAKEIKEGRKELYQIELFDCCHEDGDIVEVLVNGVSFAAVPIMHQGTMVSIPLDRGNNVITVRGVKDGGGGVTVSFKTSRGEYFARYMSVGEEHSMDVIVR